MINPCRQALKARALEMGGEVLGSAKCKIHKGADYLLDTAKKYLWLCLDFVYNRADHVQNSRAAPYRRAGKMRFERSFLKHSVVSYTRWANVGVDVRRRNGIQKQHQFENGWKLSR